MLKEWQFNVLFFVGVGGAVLILFGSNFGLDISQNPGSITGIGAILTYVLTQRKAITRHKDDVESPEKKEGKTNERDG